jgi:hypothetical protein
MKGDAQMVSHPLTRLAASPLGTLSREGREFKVVARRLTHEGRLNPISDT